jgi:hypothetical protein
MRPTHVLSVEVLAGLPPIKQRLSFLNERFLVSAFVKPNYLLIVKLNELHRIWNNLKCLPEWQIVSENRMVSSMHLLTEFDLHLVDLTFVPNVHQGVRMGLREVDESLFPITAPRLLRVRCSGSFRVQPPSIPTVQKPRIGRNWDIFG